MVVNTVTGRTLVQRLQRAETFGTRLAGLMFRPEMATGEGLLLTPCKGIHTFFMRFCIDVVYLDGDMQVIAAFPEVKPWRVLPQMARAACVLEMAPGVLSESGTRAGHALAIADA